MRSEQLLTGYIPFAISLNSIALRLNYYAFF